MKIALVHDHLAQNGGAEKVLKVLCGMFPDAPIYTLLYDEKNADKFYKTREIKTSIIQRLPLGIRFYKWYMPLMPLAVEFFDLSEYDIVISDASAFAKGVITKDNTLHICYCHTPTRYLWSDTHQYINELKYNKYFKKIIALSLNKIRIWDRLAADRVDFFIANSNFIAKRIQKYYKRDSVVIYPPVDLEKFYISEKPRNYFLAGGRLVPYKRFDLLIEAFNKLRDQNLKLKIFGNGVDLHRLKKIAGNNENIIFLGLVSEDEKALLYSEAIAYLHPQEEDFGITVIESMASGRPVIAFRAGGVQETVLENKTGIFFEKQNSEELAEVIKNFDESKFNPREIRTHALDFSQEKFENKIKELIKSKI